jgi:hypothetical protein
MIASMAWRNRSHFWAARCVRSWRRGESWSSGRTGEARPLDGGPFLPPDKLRHTGEACPWQRTGGRRPCSRSSREVPHGPPLSRHRAYGRRTTAVSLSVQHVVAGCRIDQTELVEPGDGSWPASLAASWPGTTILCRTRPAHGPAAAGPRIASGSAATLVAVCIAEPHAAQLAAQPAPGLRRGRREAAQFAARVCMTEIRDPSGQKGIRLVDHLLQADAPIAFGDLTQAIPSLPRRRPGALFCWLTRSRKRWPRNLLTEAMTRSPAAGDRT